MSFASYCKMIRGPSPPILSKKIQLTMKSIVTKTDPNPNSEYCCKTCGDDIRERDDVEFTPETKDTEHAAFCEACYDTCCPTCVVWDGINTGTVGMISVCKKCFKEDAKKYGKFLISYTENASEGVCTFSDIKANGIQLFEYEENLLLLRIGKVLKIPDYEAQYDGINGIIKFVRIE